MSGESGRKTVRFTENSDWMDCSVSSGDNHFHCSDRIFDRSTWLAGVVLQERTG